MRSGYSTSGQGINGDAPFPVGNKPRSARAGFSETGNDDDRSFRISPIIEIEKDKKKSGSLSNDESSYDSEDGMVEVGSSEDDEDVIRIEER